MAERSCDLLAQREGHLRASPDVGAAIALGAHDAGVRLDVSLVHRFGCKSILDDDVRFAKSRLDIALSPVHMDEHVARLVDRMQQTAIARHVRMKQYGVRLDRRERVEQRFEFLILDIDQIHRFFSDSLTLRRHRRDFFADKAHDAVGEDRHVVNFSADQKTMNICAGGDRVHAGQRQGPADVDLLNPAVR